MAEVSPLPIRGEVVVDARGELEPFGSRGTPSAGLVVLSIWRGDTCAATVQVDSAEVPHLVDVLVRGLAASSAPPRPYEATA